MVRYRTQSADTLNEADRFEDILNWTLFANEQNQRLWSDPKDWCPGDPLWEIPWELYDGQGNYVRPMFEIIHWRTFHNRDKIAMPIRCDPCEVNWVGKEPCWVCGEEREPVFSGSGTPWLQGIPRFGVPGALNPFIGANPGALVAVEDFDVEAVINHNRFHYLAEASFWGAEHLTRPLSLRRLSMESPRNNSLQYNYDFLLGASTIGGVWIGEWITDNPVPLQAEETTRCADISSEFSVENLYVPQPPDTSMRIQLPSNLDLNPIQPIQAPVVDRRNAFLDRYRLQHSERRTFPNNEPATERRRS